MVTSPSVLGLAAVGSVAVYLGLHHAILSRSALLRERRLHTIVAAWCAAVFAYTVARGVQFEATSPSAVLWASRVQIGVVALPMLLVQGVMYRMSTRRSDRFRTLISTAVFSSFVGVALPYSMATELHRRVDPFGHPFAWPALDPRAVVVMIVVILAVLVGGLRGLARTEYVYPRTRRLMNIGFVLLAVAGTNDLILTAFDVPSTPLFEYAFLSIAVLLDSITVHRFQTLYASLERAVSERTEELRASTRRLAEQNAAVGVTNEKLEVALAQAEETTRARTDFVARVSHEIRTPLNGILGLTALLDDARLDPQQKAFVTALIESGERLRSVVDEVLDFTKLEAGRGQVTKQVFDPAGLAERLAFRMAPLAERRHLALSVDVALDVPFRVEGDAMRVEQVLANLVGNALKFTDEGEVAIALSLEAGELVMRVRDTGIGIPEKDRGRVFEPFLQARRETLHHYGGTGLGLAIGRRLAEAMGGSLELEPSERGSLFRFAFPFGAVDAADTRLAGRTLIVAIDGAEGDRLAQQLTRLGATVRRVPRAELVALTPRGETTFVRGSEELDVLERSGGPIVVVGNVSAAPRARRVLLVPPTAEAILEALRPSRAPPSSDSLRRPVETAAAVPNAPQHEGTSAAPSPSSRVPSAPPAPAPSARRPSLAGLRVLVADDHEVSRMVLANLLTRLGCEPLVASDGLEALALATTDDTPLDVALLDCHMPALDGWETVERLRQHERRSGLSALPVFAVSAGLSPDETERASAAGFDGFLPKPLQLPELVRVLESVRGGTQRRSLFPSAASVRPTAGPAEQSLVDMTVLTELASLAADEPGFGADLVGSFEETVPNHVEALRIAHAAGNHESVRRHAHALSGACRTIGARGMGVLASEIEREPTSPEVPRRIDRLERDFATTREVLREHLAPT